MKIETGPDGAVIAAEDLGELLDIDPGELSAKMQAGEVTSIYETGEGRDAGRFRLTFWHGQRRVRLICAEDGTILERRQSRVRR